MLFYSPVDTIRWQALMEKSRTETDVPPTVSEAAEILLEDMRGFCSPGRCRHRALSEYFGQSYEAPRCGACDICLGEFEEFEEGTIAAQMILSCVARVGQRFDVGHVVDVLRIPRKALGQFDGPRPFWMMRRSLDNDVVSVANPGIAEHLAVASAST